MENSISRGLAFERRCSLLEAHKTVYLMQVLGFPFGLHFEKGVYGPYSQPLDRAVSAMEGHQVTGYGDGTSGAQATLEITETWADRAEKVIASSARFQHSYRRFERLVNGFEDAFGMELLGTVYFSAKEIVTPPATLEKVTACVRQWNSRKYRIFSEPHVQRAWERFNEISSS